MAEKQSDITDNVLNAGSLLDWITPLFDAIRGYNTIEYDGDGDTATAVYWSLKGQGVDCILRAYGNQWIVASK